MATWTGFSAMEAAKRDIEERKTRWKRQMAEEDDDPPPPYEIIPFHPVHPVHPVHPIHTARLVQPFRKLTGPKKKERIPAAVRNAIWVRAFKDSLTGVCQCCKIEKITYGNFHAGHVISEHNGGATTVDNLRPVCPLCNTSMGTHNMDEFIKKYGF